MRLIVSLFLCLLVAFMPHVAQAQHYEHATFWAKTTIAAPLSKNWDVQFEYVHRQQNNFRESRWNPFSHESLEEPRLWFYFKQPTYIIQLNPITYIYSEPLLGKESDFNLEHNEEWRSVVGLELFQNVGKWTIKERVQYEYRWQKLLNYVPTGRIRLKGTVQYQVTLKTKMQVYNEVFLNTPPHKFANNFDQDWFLVGINHTINDHVNFDLGIMRNYRKRVNGIEFDHETAINGGFNFRIF
jgi:Protein of unknown function (DUF2490)